MYTINLIKLSTFILLKTVLLLFAVKSLYIYVPWKRYSTKDIHVGKFSFYLALWNNCHEYISKFESDIINTSYI